MHNGLCAYAGLKLGLSVNFIFLKFLEFHCTSLLNPRAATWIVFQNMFVVSRVGLYLYSINNSLSWTVGVSQPSSLLKIMFMDNQGVVSYLKTSERFGLDCGRHTQRKYWVVGQGDY